MAYEYKTTIGGYHCGGWNGEEHISSTADDPSEPDWVMLGSEVEWELVSTAAADGLIFWAWRRAQ